MSPNKDETGPRLEVTLESWSFQLLLQPVYSKERAMDMKLLVLILAGLSIGVTSGSRRICFRRRGSVIRLSNIQKESEPTYAENAKPASLEVPELDSSPVSTEAPPGIRNLTVSDIFSSQDKVVNDANTEKPHEFSSKTKSNAQGTNSDGFSSTERSKGAETTNKLTNSKTSDDVSISNETAGFAKIMNAIDSSSTLKPKATEKNSEDINTKNSDGVLTEISHVTDASRDVTNYTDSDANEMPEVTSHVTKSTNPEIENLTKSTRGTDGITNAKDSTSSSTPLIETSKDTVVTYASISIETSTGSDVVSEISKSEISENPIKSTAKRRTDGSYTAKNTVFASTDHPTSKKNPHTDIDSERSSITVSSSSIQPDFLSTTQLYSTEHGTTINTSTKPQETTLDHTETSERGTKVNTSTKSDETTIDHTETSERGTTVSTSTKPQETTLDHTETSERGTTVNLSTKSNEYTVDHIETTHIITTIELPATRTLKLAVSITFLVIALIAFVVLIVYIIKSRKRTFQYDELMLLP